MDDYSKVFSIQWKNYCNEFLLEARKRSNMGLRAEKLNEWYDVNIQRWDNAAEREGSALLEQDNKEKTRQFLDKLYAFKFQEEPEHKDKRPLMRGGMMLLLAVAIPLYASLHLELPIQLIEVEYWRTVVAGICVAIFAVIKTYSDMKRVQSNEDERRREAYTNQLRNYGNKMTDFWQEIRG